LTDKLIDDIDKLTDLALSVGVQAGKYKGIPRPLIPLEVAQYIQQIKNETNETDSQISKRLRLGRPKSKSGKIMTDVDVEEADPSQVKKFLKLLKWSKKSVSGIGFKGDPNKAPFSVALEALKLEPSEQDVIIRNILKYKLTKDEIKRVIQYKEKYQLKIDECIQKVLKIRPEKSTQYMVVYNIPNTVYQVLKELGNSTEEISKKLVELIKLKLKGEIEQVTINESLLIIFMDTTAYKSFEQEMESKDLTYNQCVKRLLIGESNE